MVIKVRGPARFFYLEYPNAKIWLLGDRHDSPDETPFASCADYDVEVADVMEQVLLRNTDHHRLVFIEAFYSKESFSRIENQDQAGFLHKIRERFRYCLERLATAARAARGQPLRGRARPTYRQLVDPSFVANWNRDLERYQTRCMNHFSLDDRSNVYAADYRQGPLRPIANAISNSTRTTEQVRQACTTLLQFILLHPQRGIPSIRKVNAELTNFFQALDCFPDGGRPKSIQILIKMLRNVHRLSMNQRQQYFYSVTHHHYHIFNVANVPSNVRRLMYTVALNDLVSICKVIAACTGPQPRPVLVMHYMGASHSYVWYQILQHVLGHPVMRRVRDAPNRCINVSDNLWSRLRLPGRQTRSGTTATSRRHARLFRLDTTNRWTGV